MKFLIIISILFSSFNLFAQQIDDQPIAELESQYIRLLDYTNQIGGTGNVKIDYGQKVGKQINRFIQDETGERYKFNSIADLLNMMYQNGYELKETIITYEDPDENDIIYILKKI